MELVVPDSAEVVLVIMAAPEKVRLALVLVVNQFALDLWFAAHDPLHIHAEYDFL